MTKKGRLEYLFFVDADQEHVDALASYLALELGTLGVRVFDPHHICFGYEFCQVRLTIPGKPDPQALVRVKQLLDSDGQVLSIKAEMEDLKMALTSLDQVEPGLSLKGIRRLVEQVVQDQAEHMYRNVQAVYLGGLSDEQDPAPTG
jgi:uncharacterized protein (DUF111 family)